MTLVTRLDFALAYAGAGLKVIPLQPNGKLPLTPHGAHDSPGLPLCNRMFQFINEISR